MHLCKDNQLHRPEGTATYKQKSNLVSKSAQMEISSRPRWSRRENRVVSSSRRSNHDDQGSVFSTSSVRSQQTVRWDNSKKKIVTVNNTHWDRHSKTVKREGMDSTGSFSDRSSVSTKDSPKTVIASVPEQEAVSYSEINNVCEASLPESKPKGPRPQSADLAALRKKEKEKKLRDIMNQVTARIQDDKRQMDERSSQYHLKSMRGKDVPVEITASSDQSIVSNFSELFS